MSCLRLDHEKPVASIWGNPSLPWITPPEVRQMSGSEHPSFCPCFLPDPRLFSAKQPVWSFLTFSEIILLLCYNPFNGSHLTQQRRKSQVLPPMSPQALSDLVPVTCRQHLPTSHLRSFCSCPLAALLSFNTPGARQPPGLCSRCFLCQECSPSRFPLGYNSFISFRFAQNSLLQWGLYWPFYSLLPLPLLRYELPTPFTQFRVPPMAHTTFQHTRSFIMFLIYFLSPLARI